MVQFHDEASRLIWFPAGDVAQIRDLGHHLMIVPTSTDGFDHSFWRPITEVLFANGRIERLAEIPDHVAGRVAEALALVRT
jgi:hypothetical protein